MSPVLKNSDQNSFISMEKSTFFNSFMGVVDIHPFIIRIQIKSEHINFINKSKYIF